MVKPAPATATQVLDWTVRVSRSRSSLPWKHWQADIATGLGAADEPRFLLYGWSSTGLVEKVSRRAACSALAQRRSAIIVRWAVLDGAVRVHT
jgi:hypothetical protein